jgi:AraC-like DNA-binding protein
MERVGKKMSYMEHMKQIVDDLATHRIRIHTCYNVTVRSQWKIENRTNSDFHIVYIKGGEGFYSIGGERVPFSKGKIIFVSQGTLYSAYQNPERPPSIIPVRFGMNEPGTGSGSQERQQLQARCPPFSFAYTPNDRQSYERLFEQVYLYYKKRENGYCDALSGTVLSEILLKLVVEMTEAGAWERGDARLEKAKGWIDEHPCERLDPDGLAEMAGLSEKYFRSLFKHRYGMTPFEYQIKARLEYARFLLAESGQSVKQVALSIGYPDPYSFSKQFKQVMGYPPVRLRRQHGTHY